MRQENRDAIECYRHLFIPFFFSKFKENVTLSVFSCSNASAQMHYAEVPSNNVSNRMSCPIQTDVAACNILQFRMCCNTCKEHNCALSCVACRALELVLMGQTCGFQRAGIMTLCLKLMSLCVCMFTTLLRLLLSPNWRCMANVCSLMLKLELQCAQAMLGRTRLSCGLNAQKLNICQIFIVNCVDSAWQHSHSVCSVHQKHAWLASPHTFTWIMSNPSICMLCCWNGVCFGFWVSFELNTACGRACSSKWLLRGSNCWSTST